MGLLGIGVDIIAISRMAEILARTGDVFLDRVFTSEEKQAGENHPHPAAYYAARFAAKEAIFKLFCTSWENGLDMLEIEISQGRSGQPIVRLSGRFQQLAEEKGSAGVLLSLSSDDDKAIAFAALVT